MIFGAYIKIFKKKGILMIIKKKKFVQLITYEQKSDRNCKETLNITHK